MFIKSLGIPLRCDLFRERLDQKNFLLQQQIIVLALRRSIKYFCGPNSPLFPRSGEEKKNRGNHEAFTQTQNRKS